MALRMLSSTDPLLFDTLSKIMIARTMLNENQPSIPSSELSKKVTYILELKNEEPLILNGMDIYRVRNALENRTRTGDILTNTFFLSTIDRLARNNFNRQIEIEIQRERENTLEDLNPDDENFGGSRRRKKRKTRKYKK